MEQRNVTKWLNSYILETVKTLLLDGLIDSLITYMVIGASVSLGEFGTIRPTFGCASQDDEKEVTTDVLKNSQLLHI